MNDGTDSRWKWRKWTQQNLFSIEDRLGTERGAPPGSLPPPAASNGDDRADAGALPPSSVESSELDTPSTPTVPSFNRHPRAKRYLIRVKPDGTVRVTIPRRGSKREAQAFVDAQQAWIVEQVRKAARLRASRRQPMAPERVRELRARAARELPARLLQLAARLGLTVARVSIRNQRWRWGSCSRQGHICLNWRLVDMRADVCDYVLVHELMHLRRMDHSPKFWALVAAACPDYQHARRWLRDHERGMLED